MAQRRVGERQGRWARAGVIRRANGPEACWRTCRVPMWPCRVKDLYCLDFRAALGAPGGRWYAPRRLLGAWKHPLCQRAPARAIENTDRPKRDLGRPGGPPRGPPSRAWAPVAPQGRHLVDLGLDLGPLGPRFWPHLALEPLSPWALGLLWPGHWPGGMRGAIKYPPPSRSPPCSMLCREDKATSLYGDAMGHRGRIRRGPSGRAK